MFCTNDKLSMEFLPMLPGYPQGVFGLGTEKI